jgi:hypothetical protein
MSPVLRHGGPIHTTHIQESFLVQLRFGFTPGIFLGVLLHHNIKIHVAGSPPRRTDPHHIQESFLVQLRFGLTPGIFFGVLLPHEKKISSRRLSVKSDRPAAEDGPTTAN